MAFLPQISSSSATRSAAFPKRVSVPAACSEKIGVSSAPAARSFAASANAAEKVQNEPVTTNPIRSPVKSFMGESPLSRMLQMVSAMISPAVMGATFPGAAVRRWHIFSAKPPRRGRDRAAPPGAAMPPPVCAVPARQSPHHAAQLPAGVSVRPVDSRRSCCSSSRRSCARRFSSSRRKSAAAVGWDNSAARQRIRCSSSSSATAAGSSRGVVSA